MKSSCFSPENQRPAGDLPDLPLPVFSAANLRAWPGHDDGGRALYQPVRPALESRYATDAHTAGYSAPSVPRRLDKGAPGSIVDGSPLVVPMVVQFVDVDGADHKADPAWRVEENAKIAHLFEVHPGFAFHSRGGYKLAWRRAAPFLVTSDDDAARWRLHTWRTLLYLSRRFAIVGDPACADWTRLFRLPHTTRPQLDGQPGAGPEELPVSGDPELATPFAFEPDPADLGADLAEARRLHQLHPATVDGDGKTKVAGPWGAAVKALSMAAGEAPAPPAPQPRPAASQPRGRGRPSIEERERLWCKRMLENLAADVARAGRGNRNSAARDAALILGHYAPRYLNPDNIARELLAACERNGLVRDDGREAARATIERAITDGMREPKRPELPDDEPRAAGPRKTTQSTAPEGGAMREHQEHDEHDQEQASASGQSTPSDDNRPVVLVDFETGQRVRDAEAALAARDDLNLYVRDGRLVSVQTTTSKRLRAVRDDAGAPLARDLELPALRAMLTDTIRFERMAEEKDKTTGEKTWNQVRCRPHDDIVKGLHKATEWPHLRDLVGIVRAPFLASLSGDVVTVAGYHEESGYLLVTPPGYGAVEVPDRPTREQALQALETIKDLLSDFPFAGERDQSAALAALLSLVARPALGGENVPGFVFEANTSSAGKTKLADTLAIIATGAQSPKQGFTRDEAEMEKLLGGLAGEARALLSFDNITETIGGSKLDLVLTCNGLFSYRLLGFNKTAHSAWRTVLFFTANNPTIGGDIGRRLLVCRLDCADAQPSKREGFKYQLPRYAMEHRARLAGCALTILRAFCQVPERKRPRVRAMGSFEAWSQLVAGSLLWLGEADPLEAVADERNEGMDPQRMAHVAIVEHWNELKTNTRSANRWTIDGIAVRAALDALYPGGAPAQGDGLDDLREALEVLAPPAGGKPPTVARVGYALRHLRGKLTPEGEAIGDGTVTKGGKLEGKADRKGVVAWQVVGRAEGVRQGWKKTSKAPGMPGIAGDVPSPTYAGAGDDGGTHRGGWGGGSDETDARMGSQDPRRSPASPATDSTVEPSVDTPTPPPVSGVEATPPANDPEPGVIYPTDDGGEAVEV